MLTLRWPGQLNTNQAFWGGRFGASAKGRTLWAFAKALTLDYSRARRWAARCLPCRQGHLAPHILCTC